MNQEAKITLEFPEMNPEKRLRKLILHIADRLEDDKDFGMVKLAKILYFADFASYHLHKEPITGSAYLRWDKGPVPEGLLTIIDEMVAEGSIAIQERRIIDHTQKRVIRLREPDLSMFSGRDIQIIEDMIRKFEGKTARELSEISHGIAWKVTPKDEKIPYEYSELSDESVTKADIEWAEELAREYGLG